MNLSIHLNNYMFAHTFQTIEHWSLGPIRNRYGFIFAVIEIDDVWILAWQDPEGLVYSRYYSDHDHVVTAIEQLNAGRSL
jgi:hypothetical protein